MTNSISWRTSARECLGTSALSVWSPKAACLQPAIECVRWPLMIAAAPQGPCRFDHGHTARTSEKAGARLPGERSSIRRLAPACSEDRENPDTVRSRPPSVQIPTSRTLDKNACRGRRRSCLRPSRHPPDKWRPRRIAPVPPEPVIFTKAISCIQGCAEDVRKPRLSTKMD